MTPFVPLSQALDQSREIGALREHARVYLAVVVDQDDEITALKAALRALVEAALDLRGAEGWYPVARGSALRRLDLLVPAAQAALERVALEGRERPLTARGPVVQGDAAVMALKVCDE